MKLNFLLKTLNGRDCDIERVFIQHYKYFLFGNLKDLFKI